VIVGVGGQGILLTSDVIAEACIMTGIPVKGAETHGMAQRGGSVETHLRIGCMHGPTVRAASADLLIAFEPLEGVRYAHFLSREGTAIVNTMAIKPAGRDTVYPELSRLLSIIRGRCARLIADDFSARAVALGSARVLNIFMLGVATRWLPLDKEALAGAIEKVVKPQFVEMNLAALDQGYTYQEGDHG